ALAAGALRHPGATCVDPRRGPAAARCDLRSRRGVRRAGRARRHGQGILRPDAFALSGRAPDRVGIRLPDPSPGDREPLGRASRLDLLGTPRNSDLPGPGTDWTIDSMKILYYGDVFGRPGREAVLASLPRLMARHSTDFVVICGENAAHGRGITPEMCE